MAIMLRTSGHVGKSRKAKAEVTLFRTLGKDSGIVVWVGLTQILGGPAPQLS